MKRLFGIPYIRRLAFGWCRVFHRRYHFTHFSRNL